MSILKRLIKELVRSGEVTNITHKQEKELETKSAIEATIPYFTRENNLHEEFQEEAPKIENSFLGVTYKTDGYEPSEAEIEADKKFTEALRKIRESNPIEESDEHTKWMADKDGITPNDAEAERIRALAKSKSRSVDYKIGIDPYKKEEEK